jgi:hypothetical protein
MIGQGQAQYFYTPPQQFTPELWQVAPPQAQQPTVGALLVDLLGKVVVVGIGVAFSDHWWSAFLSAPGCRTMPSSVPL